MSGQPVTDPEVRAFNAFMELIDWLFGEDAPTKFEFDDKLIDVCEKAGALNWHRFYANDQQDITEEFQADVEARIGFPGIGDNMTIKQLASTLEELVELIRSELTVDDPEIEASLLVQGVSLLIISRALKVSFWCQIKFGCAISELIELSRQGDHEAFFKLVQLDSTFLCSDFAKMILGRAELRNDTEFRSRLARSISPKKGFWSIEGGRKNLRDAFALWFLSQIGYATRPYTDWADFLAERGFDNLASDQYVAKACTRYNIPKKHPARTSQKHTKRHNNLDS